MLVWCRSTEGVIIRCVPGRRSGSSSPYGELITSTMKFDSRRWHFVSGIFTRTLTLLRLPRCTNSCNCSGSILVRFFIAWNDSKHSSYDKYRSNGIPLLTDVSINTSIVTYRVQQINQWFGTCSIVSTCFQPSLKKQVTQSQNFTGRSRTPEHTGHFDSFAIRDVWYKRYTRFSLEDVCREVTLFTKENFILKKNFHLNGAFRPRYTGPTDADVYMIFVRNLQQYQVHRRTWIYCQKNTVLHSD